MVQNLGKPLAETKPIIQNMLNFGYIPGTLLRFDLMRVQAWE